MSTFPLRILTPKGIIFDEEVLSLTVPTEKGPLCIEPGYTNIITSISKAGVLLVVTPTQKRYFAIFGGSLDVSKLEGTSIFTEEINDGYEIDMARAIAARDRNQDRLDKRPEGIDIVRAKAKLAKALVRINVKQLSEGLAKDSGF